MCTLFRLIASSDDHRGLVKIIDMPSDLCAAPDTTHRARAGLRTKVCVEICV